MDKIGCSILECLIFSSMDLPLPDVEHTLSIKIGDDTYSCDVSAYGLPVYNYYAIVLIFDMEWKFFRDLEIEEIYLNQYYPVQDYASALSNMKALQTNTDWVIEQAYRAIKEAEWTFEPEPPEDE